MTLELESFHYPGEAPLFAVPDRLELRPGKKVALLGGSGSGKSSLVTLLAGLHPTPLGGRPSYPPGSAPLNLPSPDRLGYLGSDPNLFLTGFCATVLEEVGWTLFGWGWEPERVKERVEQTLAELGLSELLWCDPARLSGGQQQMVALAAVWARRPAYLLLDEPASMLDPRARVRLQDTIARLADESAVGTLWSTCQLGEVAWCDELWLIEDGVIRVLPSDWQPEPGGQLVLPWSVEWSRRWDRPAPDWRDPRPNGTGELPEIRVATTAAPPAVEVKSLGYRPPAAKRDLFQALSWAVPQGECMGLVGLNGAGKTTLARLLRGLLQPTAGSVRVAGRELTGQSLPALAQTVAYTFQDPASLFLRARVDAELMYSAELLGLPEDEARARTARALSTFALDQWADRHPRELPAAKTALLGVALSWLTFAPVQILDEPLALLDRPGRAVLEAALAAWRAEGTTVVLIGHDLDWLATVCTGFTVLHDGKVLAQGSGREVFGDPEVRRKLGGPLLGSDS